MPHPEPTAAVRADACDRTHSAWNFTEAAMRMKRQPIIPRVVRRVALWNPSTAAIVAMLAGLVTHEIVYHLSGGDDFPLALLAEDTRVLVISHGGLDALGVGILVVSVLWLIEAARIKERRPR